jgi:hypothetical protein
MHLHLKTCAGQRSFEGNGFYSNFSSQSVGDCPSNVVGCEQARKLLAHYRRCKYNGPRGIGKRGTQSHPAPSTCLLCSLVARKARTQLLENVSSNASASPPKAMKAFASSFSFVHSRRKVANSAPMSSRHPKSNEIVHSVTSAVLDDASDKQEGTRVVNQIWDVDANKWDSKMDLNSDDMHCSQHSLFSEADTVNNMDPPPCTVSLSLHNSLAYSSPARRRERSLSHADTIVSSSASSTVVDALLSFASVSSDATHACPPSSPWNRTRSASVGAVPVGMRIIDSRKESVDTIGEETSFASSRTPDSWESKGVLHDAVESNATTSAPQTF